MRNKKVGRIHTLFQSFVFTVHVIVDESTSVLMIFLSYLLPSLFDARSCKLISNTLTREWDIRVSYLNSDYCRLYYHRVLFDLKMLWALSTSALGESDIRLLLVTVHDGAAALLELYTYPRTAAPEYDAVNYNWGDDTSTTSMMCNGVPLRIRTNPLELWLSCMTSDLNHKHGNCGLTPSGLYLERLWKACHDKLEVRATFSWKISFCGKFIVPSVSQLKNTSSFT